MRLKFSTQDVQKRHQTGHWLENVNNIFVDLESKGLTDAPFYGQCDHHQIGGIGLSLIETTPVEVTRTKQNIAKLINGHFKFSFQIEGSCLLTQDGESTLLHPGDWAFYDSTRPYSLHLPKAYKQLVIQIPRELILSHMPNPTKVTPIKLNGASGLGFLATNFALNTKYNLDELPQLAHASVSNSLVSLLTAGVNSHNVENGNQAEDRSLLLMQIKSFIHSQLSNPDLSLALLSRKFHISKRYLHLLFEGEETTINTYIRDLRLEKCRADLLDPQKAHASLLDIGFAWGFNSLSHFSRSFKAKYGVSASALRRESMH